MKLIPFDLEAAKSGKSIVCRDGTPAKFIAHVPEARGNLRHVIVLTDHSKAIYFYDESGSAFSGFTCSDLDLFMVPEKKTGWLNIYQNGESCFWDRKDTADYCANINRIACVEVTYTEGEGL